MENENVKTHPVKRFFKAVGKALPDILMFASIYFLVFLLIFGMISALETDTKADVLAAENEYLKGQIEWYQAQLSDEPYIPAPAITDGDPDE
jgi:hypothetical protein